MFLPERLERRGQRLPRRSRALKNDALDLRPARRVDDDQAEAAEDDDRADERDRDARATRTRAVAAARPAAQARMSAGLPIAQPRRPAYGVKTGGADLVGQPLAGDRPRACRPRSGRRSPVDAGGQRAALGEHDAEVLGSAPWTGNWPTIAPLSSWAPVM